MGYDLHIVRTRQWVDARNSPIEKHEVDALVAADRTLRWSATDYVQATNPENGEVISYRSRYPAIEWTRDRAFWYDGKEITCKNPGIEQQIKMVEMAEQLGAMVVGDEDEIYRVKKTWLGRKRIVCDPWAEI